MPIDAYSPCPGGTGKKVKFCCPDFVGELDKIARMIDGEQYAACLQHVRHLREQPANRDRQCLLAFQAAMLRVTKQIEAAEAHSAAFLEKYPNNQNALAEASMLASLKADVPKAMNYFQRAVAASDAHWTSQTYFAAQFLAETCLHQQQWLPARGVLQFLLAANEKNEDVAAMLMEVFSSPEAPAVAQGRCPSRPTPRKRFWKEGYRNAIEPSMIGDFLTTESRLAALAAETPAPEIWSELAMIRGWLGDTAGCTAALRRYAGSTFPLKTPPKPRPARCSWPKTRWAMRSRRSTPLGP